MSTTTDLTTLKINYLTQAQYDEAVAEDEINENEIYMTPASEIVTEYDFETSLTPSIDARGTYALAFLVYPVDVTDLTMSNIGKIKAYLVSNTIIYPLIFSYGYISSSLTYVNVHFKSISESVQSTSSSTVTGTLHIIAPFEISSVTSGK